MSAVKKMSDHAHAAKLIRQELKAAFPTIKFSVTSQSYSMGDNVRINWENGPTSHAVNKIINKYQYGHFNGMEDIYEHSNCNGDLPQAKFVFGNRHISDGVMQQAFDYAKLTDSTLEDVNKLSDSIIHERVWLGNNVGVSETVSTYLWRVLGKMDLTKGFDSVIYDNGGV